MHARCIDLKGTIHGTNLMVSFVPEIALDTMRSIANFAKESDVLAKL